MFKKLFTAAVVALSLLAAPALAQEEGTISIPVTEYNKMKDQIEAKEKKLYWNMTYEQILEKERGNATKAWDLYDYWVNRNLKLHTQVGGSAVNTLIKDIKILNEINNNPITISIASPGGSVYDGLELYNAMMDSVAPVNTRCDGMAASMAAVLLAAGDTRYASTACHFMLHEVAGNLGGGKTIDFVKNADFVVDLEAMLLTILSENSGISMVDLRKMAIYEMFYDSEETLALGFVDKVVGDKPRVIADGARVVPEDLWPTNRMKRNLADKIGN